MPRLSLTAAFALYRETLTPAHRTLLDRYEIKDAAVISDYKGKSDVFDESIASFSVAYADQNVQDYAAFRLAIQAGEIEAVVEEPK